MRSIFLDGVNNLSFDPIVHRKLVFKFVLVKVPGQEPILILANKDFGWHYEIVEEAVKREIVTNGLSNNWVSGGQIKNGKLWWHSNVFGGIVENDRPAIRNILGEPPLQEVKGFTWWS